MIDPKNLKHLSDDDLRRLTKLVEVKNTRVRFAKTCHRNTNGERLEFTRFRHMVDLYNSVAPEIVVVGAAQVGKTDWLIVDTFACAYNNVPVFFVLPKHDLMRSYSKEKVKKAISLSPEYKALNKDPVTDSIDLLQFGKALIKFVGSNVASDFVSFSAGCYVVDEIDKCESDENLQLGYSRLQASPYRFTRVVSNPTTKDGHIWTRWLESDQKVWLCPCQSCGHFYEIDWFKSIIKEVEDGKGNIVNHILRDDEWAMGCGRDIYIKCPDENCDGNLDRFSPECHWQSQNPNSRISGYHMPSLISPLSTVEQLWMEYLSGLQNPSKMAYFYSMKLALPYAPVGSKVTPNLLGHCVGKESQQYTVTCLPDHARLAEDTHPGPCSMGIDTSPNHIDIRISSNEKGKRKLVYVGKKDIQGVPLESITAHLLTLAERYNVKCAVIDIGPEKIAAMDFQESADFPVWMCKFLGRGEDRILKYNMSDMIISVDRTEALDRAYSQLKTGKNLLPSNYKSIMHGIYVSEMTSLVREISEDKSGKVRYTWTKGNDHAFLADAYDIMAWDTLQDDVLSGAECIFVA